MSVTIYHNPRCSKSRATLALLREHGIEPVVVEYLQNPPDVKTLGKIVAQLGIAPRQLLRKGEAEYAAAGLDDEQLEDAEVLRRMVQHPKVIERPIVVAEKGARIGRPPEQVLEVL